MRRVGAAYRTIFAAVDDHLIENADDVGDEVGASRPRRLVASDGCTGCTVLYILDDSSRSVVICGLSPLGKAAVQPRTWRRIIRGFSRDRRYNTHTVLYVYCSSDEDTYT